MIIATYVYTDENGNPLYRKLRDENKNMVWERYADGVWVSGRGGGDCPLYNLPAVIKAVESGMVIVITEGEKDAGRLIDIGIVATTTPDGANTPWRTRYTRTLAGAAHVKVYADRDPEGHEHAQDVFKELYGSVGKLEIFEADLDFKGADVSDHLDAGKTLKEMRPVEPDIAPGLGPRPKYPVDNLCGPLRQFVEWTVRDGLHAEATGPAGLAVLATLCGDARMVSPIETAPSLWLVAIGPPSSGKSPALQQAFKLVDAEFKRQMDRYVNEKMQCNGIREQGGFVRDPVPPKPWYVGDSTPEALVTTMNESNGKIAIIADELDAVLSAFGAYSTGKRGSDAERARYREWWSGRPISKVRVGTGQVYIPEPVLTIFGLLVPEDVWKLGGATNGDWARWLPSSVPPGTPVVPKEKEPVPAGWTEAVSRLMELRGIPREWRLDDDGFRLFEDACKRWREQRYNTPEHVTQALMKADAQACRMATVIAESMNPIGIGGVIPAGAMQSAIAIVDFSMKVWESIPGERSLLAVSTEARAQLNAVQRLLAWIQRREPDGNGVRKTTKREIMRAKVAGCKTAKEVDEMIDAYVKEYQGTRQHVKNDRGAPTVYIREPVTSG